MNKLFDDFLNKRIDSKTLLSKLRKLLKYFCFSNSQTKDLNILIENIRHINDNQTEKEKYENILILLDQYIKKRESKRNKISSNLSKLEK